MATRDGEEQENKGHRNQDPPALLQHAGTDAGPKCHPTLCGTRTMSPAPASPVSPLAEDPTCNPFLQVLSSHVPSHANSGTGVSPAMPLSIRTMSPYTPYPHRHRTHAIPLPYTEGAQGSALAALGASVGWLPHSIPAQAPQGWPRMATMRVHCPLSPTAPGTVRRVSPEARGHWPPPVHSGPVLTPVGKELSSCVTLPYLAPCPSWHCVPTCHPAHICHLILPASLCPYRTPHLTCHTVLTHHTVPTCPYS